VRRRSLLGLGLAAFVLLFAVPSAASVYTDWLWYRELGYEQLFTRMWNAEGTIFGITFLLVWAFLLLNLRVAGRTVRQPHVVLGAARDGKPIVVQGKTLARWTGPAAAGMALIFAGSTASANWLDWLSYFHAVPFGSVDPIFHKEISFYIFRLPIYDLVRDQALAVSVFTLIASGALYVLSGSFALEPRYGVAFWPHIRLVPTARRHLGVLGALVLGLMAVGTWLDRFRLLLSPATVLFGAGYADLHARLPFLWIAIVVLTAGAVLALVAGFGRRTWPAIVGLAAFVIVSITGSVYADIVQRLSVSPNGPEKELPFIQNNIAATRRAYALDRVDERTLSGDASLTPADIVKNAETINNVRLWDHQPLLQTFSQIQEIRTYYDFVQVDNDRYLIDGKYRQVMLSARELNTANVPSPSWVKEHLTYTHGYGLTLGPVNQVTTEGLPVLFIRDLPPVSTVNLAVDEPSIYFGEISNDYVIVRTKTPELHYPRGNDNVMTTYAGTGGVPLGSFWRRVLFALRFWTTDILVTDQITPESRVLYNRQIVNRVQTLAPFLSLDADPYPVISGGRIFWIQDAYTTTDGYPYSTPADTPWGEINYIRNSVKIVTDAYNGTTTFYLSEPNDPLALTLASVFPGLLRPLTDMPVGLRQHVRYPEDIFAIQASIFATFHMTSPTVFYAKEDQWQPPALGDSDRTATPMRPYYTVMKLPGESQPEFIQMLPFTPQLKNNLSAWLVARSDGTHYGHLIAFEFPKQRIVFGPQQIVARINQDQLISPQITLWNQQGSEVNWGTLLVIPIEESLLYVRPLYLRSAKGIPELKRVVVAYQNQIVMDETLKAALAKIFGPQVAAALPSDRLDSTATSVVTPPPGTPDALQTLEPSGTSVMSDLAAEAQAHFERMQKAARDGNWALFGEEQNKLGDVLAQMAKAAPAGKTPSKIKKQ
jgi:uncharacterized membrane protein (UPF0182 family)